MEPFRVLLRYRSSDLFPSPHLHAPDLSSHLLLPWLWAHPWKPAAWPCQISAPALLMTFTLQPVASSKTYPWLWQPLVWHLLIASPSSSMTTRLSSRPWSPTYCGPCQITGNSPSPGKTWHQPGMSFPSLSPGSCFLNLQILVDMSLLPRSLSWLLRLD